MDPHGVPAGGPLPIQEAMKAVFLWLREGLGESAAEAEANTLLALELAMARVPDGRETPLVWPASPREVVRAFEKRISSDPDLALAPESIRRSARVSVPPAWLDRWSGQFGSEAALELAESFGEPSPLDLRVWRKGAGRAKAIEAFREAGIEGKPTNLAPEGVRLAKKGNLKNTPLPATIRYEIQDEGSQMVALALEDCLAAGKVLDACAGSGGKSMHLADLACEGLTVYSHDLEERRIEPLKERLITEPDLPIQTLPCGGASTMAPYDAVLIDAPCSGMGRLRRDPILPWRLRIPEDMERIVAAQRDCLDTYAPLVRPGGVVVYATCSFEAEETRELVASWLAEHRDFATDPLPERFQRASMALARGADGSQVTLLPHREKTDGFFIARLRRLR